MLTDLQPHSVLAQLSPLARIFLHSNGTLTDLLQLIFLEPTHTETISTEYIIDPIYQTQLELGENEPILMRNVLIRGKSGRAYVAAKSMIAANRLSPSMQHALNQDGASIGKIWLQQKTELFKKFISHRVGEDTEAAQCLGIACTETFLTRSYIAYCSNKPLALIQESMPKKYFE